MKQPEDDSYRAIVKGCGWTIAIVISVIWILWLASQSLVPNC